MKSYIDFFETLKGEFVGSLKFKNKFVRLWGITTIDGIKVLSNRFVIYPGMESREVQSFLKHIGSLESMKNNDFGSVVNYYFWINSSKADTLSQENLNDIIASKINEYCDVGEKLKINLNFSNAGDYNYFKNFTKQDIYNYIVADYDAMYNTLDNYAVGETLLTTTIGTYILFDNNQHFNVEVISGTVSAIATQSKLNSWDNNYTTVYKAGLSIEIQATRKDNVTGSANIVTHIVDEADEEHRTTLQQLLESETNESTISGSAWKRNRATGKTDDIWYKGNMRLSFLDSNSITIKQKIKILISSLDTGYTLPKTKWWKKILGPVLIIIAIVLAILFPPAGGILMGIAINVGVATLVMTGLSVYWGKHGDPRAAQYMGKWIKVGGIISAVAGIAAIVTNIARQASLTTATTAATETAIATGEVSTVTATSLGQTITVTATPTVTSYGTAITITQGGAGALVGQTASVGLGNFVSAGWDSIYGGISSSWQSMASTGLKMVRFFTNMRFQTQAKSVQNEVNSKTEQLDKANQELEDINEKEIDICNAEIKWYTDGLKIQSQEFDIDKLYGGTRHNIGRPSFVTGRGINIISNDVFDVNKI